MKLGQFGNDALLIAKAVATDRKDSTCMYLFAAVLSFSANPLMSFLIQNNWLWEIHNV